MCVCVYMYMKILFDNNDYLHLYVNVKTNSFPHLGRFKKQNFACV